MDPALFRILTFICAALAGWALGRSNPGWDSDMEGELINRPGDYRSSVRLFGGSCLAGTGALSFWLILAIVGFMFGWGETVPSGKSIWLLLGLAFAAYAVARFTDKGPAGPLQ
jgi:hypothetical protein